MAEQFDVVVIGGGPGGYVAAIRAAQLGLQTACIDSRGRFGGTCLNVGCIPSKAMLQSSERFEAARLHFTEHGIVLGEVGLDLPKMLARKEKIVEATVKGIDFLFKKNKVTPIAGTATLTGPNRVMVTLAGGGTRVLDARHIVLATGSTVTGLPGVEIDEERVLSSTGALSLTTVPDHLVVIGGGYIGLEMGSIWRRLGARVTVVEFLDRITPTMDAEVGQQLQRILTKQGMAFQLGVKVVGVARTATGVALTVMPAAGGAESVLECAAVLVAVGRRPFTEGLGLEGVGIACDAKGRVETNGAFQTAVPSIWAIGDCIAGPMLAHKAEEEGVAVAEIIAGQSGHVNYAAIPAVIYTNPEVASVGATEEELKAAGTSYRVGKFPFSANGRARANGDSEGFVKLLADAATDRLLGAHIIGADAGTMIAELALALEFSAAAEDIARTSHAHPTLNEAVKEAAMAVGGWTIHL